MGNPRGGSAPATFFTATKPSTTRRTPAVLWLAIILAAVFLWLPLSGVSEGLASVPHTGMGCDAGSGPVCGNQGEALWASAVLAVVVAALYLGALMIITVENRKLTRHRHWPAPVTLTAYAAIVFLCSFLLSGS